MAVFRYKMQSVLNIKQKLEEQERLYLAECRQELVSENQKLTQLEENKKEYEKRLRGEMSDVLQVKDIIRTKEGVMAIEWHIAEQKESVQLAQRRVAEAQMRVAEAIQERKIQEKLREHAWQEFLEEEAKAEQKSIDELVAYQYGTVEQAEE